LASSHALKISFVAHTFLSRFCPFFFLFFFLYFFLFFLIFLFILLLLNFSSSSSPHVYILSSYFFFSCSLLTNQVRVLERKFHDVLKQLVVVVDQRLAQMALVLGQRNTLEQHLTLYKENKDKHESG
jgi:hypothetical protein